MRPDWEAGSPVKPATPPPVIGDEDQKNIVAAFEKWDLKKNGYISESELKHVLKVLGVETSQVHAMFRDVDRNRDGRIDYQEFVRWLYGSAPPVVRKTALAPSFALRVAGVFVELEDDPSFAGWWSDASNLRPFVRVRDLFTGKVLCETPEGQGLRSRIPMDCLDFPLLFDIMEEGHQAVGVEVCLARSMRGSRVLGSSKLHLAEVTTAIAQGLGTAHEFKVGILAERDEPPAAGRGSEENEAASPGRAAVAPSRAALAPSSPVTSKGSNPAAPGNAVPAPAKSASPKRTAPKKVQAAVGCIRMHLLEHPLQDRCWAARKVQCWKRDGLPPLPDLSSVHQVLSALTASPEANLEFSVLQATESLILQQLEGYASRSPEDAQSDLEEITTWLAKLDKTARQSDEVYRRGAARLAKTGDRAASSVLTASLHGKPPQHQLMRHALKFASNIDPCLPELAQVEHKFKMILQFPDRMKLSDLLMASEIDMERLEPASLGLRLETERCKLQRVDERTRYGVRDETAQRVLAMVGCGEKLQYRGGKSFERLAVDAISRQDFQLSGQLAALVAKALVFPGEAPARKRSIPAAIAARQRDWDALLGRFDVVALPARAEYDAGFNAFSTDQMPSGFFGGDPQEPVGGKGWFWVFHAAAINIGENMQADDFQAYSMPADVGYLGRHGLCRFLDEDRYVADMGTLWRRALRAAAHLNIEDMIVFPFGMGAFLRNLHQLDHRYADPAAMRRLKLRVAQGLFDAAAEVCMQAQPLIRLNICLVDGGLEARMNHNVFVESANMKVQELPDLAPLLRFYRNCDALQLAHELSFSIPPGRSDLDDEVRKIGMLNGANNKLLGNHWFANGARNAIDENLHRRSGSMCAGSLLVNMSTAPVRRSFQELASNVELLGGNSVALLPYPETAKGVRSSSCILAQIAVAPFSVLGTQMTQARQMRKNAPEPDSNTAFVDPAGLPYIQGSPSGAGGASGQIYKWLGISYDEAFPEPVREAIQEPLQAKFHAYGDKLAIHVVGPNFQGRTRCTRKDALDELSQAYLAALVEFARCGARKLRLLPISSSIFAGPFQRDMPELTAQALQRGFELLTPSEQDRVLAADRIEMCIFMEAELSIFEQAFRAA